MSTPRRQQPRQDDRVVWNAFHNVLADKRGSLSELRGVLGSNANVNIHDPIHHNHTPLIIASAVLNPHLVGLLLNAGGDPNKCNGAGTTPLTAVACKVNSAIADMASGERLLDAIDEHARAVAVIELLKNAGADVSAVNQDGKCAANLIDPRCPGSKGVLSMLKPKKRLPIDAS